MSENIVVPKPSPLSEEQFRARFMQGLSRLIGEHGESQVALWLGVSDRQLRNVKAGSLPTADKIWNLLAYDDSAHDEIDRSYGHRKVPAEAICSTDPISARISALLTRSIEAEDPSGPGGSAVTLHEIIGMDEAMLRAVHRRLGSWIDRLDEARAPAALRLVGS